MKFLVLLEAAIVAAAALVSMSGGQVGRSPALGLIESIDEAVTGEPWPGFRLADWPVALFDGSDTLLLRHPHPPEGFRPLAGRPDAFEFEGRYPGVAGNSTTEIGGVRTATVLVARGVADESSRLALVEELFHLFWLQRHADFRPNEMTRYAYPVKDPRNLQRLLAEDEAFARALEAGDPPRAAEWAARALSIRAERAPLLAADDRAYEVGLEMMEGTANYVARSVVGLKSCDTARRLRAPRAADQIRWRYYDSGAAICLLLDRLQPGWKTRVDDEPGLTTHALLEAAVKGVDARPADFSPAESAAFENRAVEAIARLSSYQRQVRADLAGRQGPRIVIGIGGEVAPLRVRRFDPVNLLVLDGGEVVHPRNITLEGPAGAIEVSNPAYSKGSFGGQVALTSAAGRHPLADGVRMITLAGLRSVPRVSRKGPQLLVEAEGIRISLEGARFRSDGDTLRIVVTRAAPSAGMQGTRGLPLLEVSYRRANKAATISPAWSRQVAALCPSGTSM